MLTRRSFLLRSAAFALAASLDWPLAAEEPAAPRRRRYLTVTPTYYRKREIDLSGFSFEKKFPKRAEYNSADLDRSTMLTVVDDDGAGLRRVLVPGLFHSPLSDEASGRIYLIGTYILVLDAKTLDVVGFSPDVKPKDDRRYSGHAVLLPSGEIAFGVNLCKVGGYDRVSIRDAKTMKELSAVSSHGFELHEVRLTTDRKALVCGHYGSYLGQNAYASLAVYDYREGPVPPPKFIYPGSVTVVDLASGKRVDLQSDVQGGQEGHADSDDRRRIYLAKQPALVHCRPDVEKNPKFREGLQTTPDGGEFANVLDHLGICLTFEPSHREIIVPRRHSMTVQVTNVDTQEVRVVDLAEQLDWKKPDGIFLHGLALHPDGKHYVISTSDGFVVLERGTHRVNPKMTFRAPLMIHTHLAVA